MAVITGIEYIWEMVLLYVDCEKFLDLEQTGMKATALHHHTTEYLHQSFIRGHLSMGSGTAAHLH